MFDRALMVLEIILLIWIVVQGEYVRFYEREVHRMTLDRFTERKLWREQKRQQQSKKETGPKTKGSNASSESISPIETTLPASKMTNAKSADVPLTLTDTPA